MKQYLPLLVAFLAACPHPSQAQQRKMVVTTKSSEVEKIELLTQTRIKFSDDRKQMIVTDGDAAPAAILAVADIAGITFTIDSTTELPEQELDHLKISYSDGIVTISASGDVDYSVWNISGALILSGQGAGIVNIDLTDLRKDVYIIKANNQTLKFIKH